MLMKTFYKASCRSAGIKNEQFLRAVMKAVLFSFRLAVCSRALMMGSVAMLVSGYVFTEFGW